MPSEPQDDTAAAWRAAGTALIAAGAAALLSAAWNGGFSTPIGRTWIFLGSQTVLETFLVAVALRGRAIAGLRIPELQRDLVSPAPIGAWIGACGVVIGYCALTIFAAPDIGRMSLVLSPLKALAILLAVSTGVFEEAFFRRFLMDSLAAKNRGPAFQIAASGLLFGLAHFGFFMAGGDPAAGFGAMAYTALLGAALGSVYVVGGRNLWPCIAAHFAINLILEPGLGLLAAGAR